GAVTRSGRGLAEHLVQLEVHVRCPRRVLDTRPEELEELATRTLLGIGAEHLQIALVGWDRARNDRRVGVVLGGAFAERVVARTAQLVGLVQDACAEVGPRSASEP